MGGCQRLLCLNPTTVWLFGCLGCGCCWAVTIKVLQTKAVHWNNISNMMLLLKNQFSGLYVLNSSVRDGATHELTDTQLFINRCFKLWKMNFLTQLPLFYWYKGRNLELSKADKNCVLELENVKEWSTMKSKGQKVIFESVYFVCSKWLQVILLL